MRHQPRYQIIPDYKHRTEGPGATIFPLLPRTFWDVDKLSASVEPVSSDSKFVRWTPQFELGAGEYDIGLGYEQNPTKTSAGIFTAKPGSSSLGKVLPIRLGDRIKAKDCVRLSLREPHNSLRLGVEIEQETDASDLAIVLVPRPGSIWRGDSEQLRHSELPGSNILYGKGNNLNNWTVNADEFVKDSFLVYGPFTRLEPGDYTVVVRFACRNWQTDSAILELDVHAPQGGQIAKRVISASDMKANEFTEVEIPFTLDVFQETTEVGTKIVLSREIEFRVKTLAPVDVTLAHIRLAAPADRIWERYFELGGLDSVLGFPLGASFAAAPAFKSKPYETRGWLRRFAAGAIYWNSKHGACEVYGEIGAHFEALGGTGRTDPPEFGFPTGIPEPVTSSYGTRGLVQKFQGFRGDARIYSFQWNGIARAHEIYGGIAHTYLRELGRHSGALGFPLSGEYWEDESRCARCNDFEGGVIRWGPDEKGEWHHLETVLYPRPTLTNLHLPNTVYAGESLTVRIESENRGGKADWGYLTLSFPQPIENEILVDSDIEIGSHKEGDLCYGGYCTRKDIPLQYQRIEGMWGSWAPGQKHFLQVTVRPQYAGQFQVLARTTAAAKSLDKYTRAGLAFRAEGDPLPLSDHPLDQQDERVYEYQVTVVDKLRPELELVKTETPALVVGFEDVLLLHVHNRGRGTARNLVILPIEKLGSSRTDPVHELLPNQDVTIEMEVTPVKAGNVGIEIHLQYQDQYGGQHDTVIKSRLKVVKEGEQRANFVFEGDTVFVRPNFGPKD